MLNVHKYHSTGVISCQVPLDYVVAKSCLSRTGYSYKTGMLRRQYNCGGKTGSEDADCKALMYSYLNQKKWMLHLIWQIGTDVFFKWLQDDNGIKTGCYCLVLSSNLVALSLSKGCYYVYVPSTI